MERKTTHKQILTERVPKQHHTDVSGHHAYQSRVASPPFPDTVPLVAPNSSTLGLGRASAVHTVNQKLLMVQVLEPLAKFHGDFGNVSSVKSQEKLGQESQ